ncbi:MAG: cyclic nucleotide-binding domain-containing protein [Mariprofundaceae bacterium]|nr:cyclic nucleotide-binding domain-containing protein [Mariprofundaceae bacterium]
MTINIKWLEENLFHRTLNYNEKNILKGLIYLKSYAKGESIILEAQNVDGLFILNKGAVTLEHQQHGQSTHVAKLEAGSQLGDMSLFTGHQASVTVKALEACEVYHLPQESMQYMMKYRQSLMHDIMLHTIRNLAQSVRDMNDNQVYAQQYLQGVRA